MSAIDRPNLRRCSSPVGIVVGEMRRFLKHTLYLSLAAAAAAVDAGRDDDDVSGRVVLLILIVGGCSGGGERVLSLCDSTRRGGAHRHRRVLVDGARQSCIHVGRQLTGDPSVPPETSRQPVLRVQHPASRRTVPPALQRHVIGLRFSVSSLLYCTSSSSSSKFIPKSTVRSNAMGLAKALLKCFPRKPLRFLANVW